MAVDFNRQIAEEGITLPSAPKGYKTCMIDWYNNGKIWFAFDPVNAFNREISNKSTLNSKKQDYFDTFTFMVSTGSYCTMPVKQFYLTDEEKEYTQDNPGGVLIVQGMATEVIPNYEIWLKNMHYTKVGITLDEYQEAKGEDYTLLNDDSIRMLKTCYHKVATAEHLSNLSWRQWADESAFTNPRAIILDGDPKKLKEVCKRVTDWLVEIQEAERNKRDEMLTPEQKIIRDQQIEIDMLKQGQVDAQVKARDYDPVKDNLLNRKSTTVNDLDINNKPDKNSPLSTVFEENKPDATKSKTDDSVVMGDKKNLNKTFDNVA